MIRATISWTTDAAGAATAYSTKAVNGRVLAVDYLPGTTDTGATFTLTAEGSFSNTILTKTTMGTSNVRFYPRVLAHKSEDGSALTGTAGGDRVAPIVTGLLKVVIASGGNTLSGSAVVYLDEEFE